MSRGSFAALGRVLGACLLLILVMALVTRAQAIPGVTSTPAPAQPDPPTDALGRTTPRGTVLGFLNAARKGENQLARQYLNTRLSDAAADVLAHQLFVVLDARLPARLTQVSDAPEGSRANPLAPNQELVGTIDSAKGAIDIVVERVERPRSTPIWLFSSRTLEAIPPLYQEIAASRAPSFMPPFLFNARVGGLRIAEWLAVLVGLPIIYLAIVLVNRILTPLFGVIARRMLKRPARPDRSALPLPARLLLTAFAARWLLAQLPLSLLVRQFFSNATHLVVAVGVAWLLILLNAEVERHVRGRMALTNVTAAGALLRVGRRVVDLLVIVVALLVTLGRLGVDLTPVLAGLGVGGLAVALAAQKTLENVIAGASLIFDQAVRVGDFLKVGEIQGTVVHIGLRSTRIRTLDRTVVTVPNSQIANLTLETLSARDKFWFHPIVGLRYDTTPEQLHAVLDGIRRLLADHDSVDAESVRVRFLRLGPFSLDIEVFAYVFARDWNHFLEIQEQLLFSVTGIIAAAGGSIALPSQTMYVEGASASAPMAGPLTLR